MKNTEKDERQYSKRILTKMVNIWIAGAWIGCGMVIVQLIANLLLGGMGTVDLSAWLGYIGGPMLGGIVGYLIKSAMEDKRKRKEGEETHEE